MLVVRIVLAFAVKGYAFDVQTFQAWALHAAKNLAGFYSGEIFADYPPGYVYVLFLIGKLKEFVQLPNDSRAFWVLIKMPAIIADLAAVLLIYRLAAVYRGERGSLALALIYGFNPAIIINSAVWGQVDAVFTIFIAFFLVCLTRDWLVRSAIVYVVALLIKPQA